MMDLAHNKTEAQLKALEKQLSAMYQDLYIEIQEEMSKTMSKIVSLPADATQQQRLIAWQKYNRLELLETQMMSQIVNVNKNAMKIVNKTWSNVYMINYDYISYMLEGYEDSIGIFPVLDLSAVNAVVSDEISPFTKISLDDMADKKQALSDISRQMVAGITLGESNDKIARRLQGVVNRNYNQSMTIARTETTRIQNNARNDCINYGAEKLKIKGIQKRWIATKDGDTRKSHQKLDGVTISHDDMFKIGSDNARFPGDFSKAENTINCRCTHVPILPKYDEPHWTYEEWEKERAKNAT